MPTSRKPKTARKAHNHPKARKAPGGAISPQFQVCALLMAEGALSRRDLRARVDVKDDTVLTNALFNAKKQKRITLDEAKKTYSITAAGRVWANGGANLENHRQADGQTVPASVKTADRGRTVKSRTLGEPDRQRLGVVTLDDRGGPVVVRSPVHLVDEPSFRSALDSAGCFAIEKAGARIALTTHETRELFRYLDRIRPPEMAVAA